MVRILHQITNTMNERLETLAGIYAAACEGLHKRHRACSDNVIACRCRLHFRNNLQLGYLCRPAA